MKRIVHIFLTAALLLPLCSSCAKLVPETACHTGGGPVEVAIGVGGGMNRTTIDGSRVKWSESDRISLWAWDAKDNPVFVNQTFRMYGLDGSRALFTAVLASAMTPGGYFYRAVYPVPVSVSGNMATFNLSAIQNGLGSDGLDVMVSDKTPGGALSPLEEGGTSCNLGMKHLLHVLKFYLKPGLDGLNGENVEKIIIRMPGGVCGTLSVDLDNPEAVLSAATDRITLQLASPIGPSTVESTDDAYAVISPCAYADASAMQVTAYSKNYIGEFAPISLKGRSFAAGHITPVPLSNPSISPYYNLNFKLNDCNLGELPYKITFSAPQGCKLGDDGSNTYVYNPGANIELGTVVTFNYAEKADFAALGGKAVTLTYESEHVICSQTVTIPDISAVTAATVGMTVPWLMYEDFASVSSFSEHDEHATSSTSSYSYSFMNGWTGGRIGAKKGQMIRIAGHRESGMWIDAHYPARVDSKPLPQIKSPVNLQLDFDYGTNSGGIDAYGQTVYIGYVTSTKAYESGDESGTYEYSFYTDTKDSNWSAPHKGSYTLHDVPAGSEIRISWRNDPKKSNDFASNTTAWLYIDNIKVKISK